MSKQESPIDLQRALRDPAAIFAEPEEILRRPEMSRDVKIAVLQKWEKLVRAQAVLEGVQVVDGEPPLLGRIIRALNALLHDQTLDAEGPEADDNSSSRQ